MIKQLTQPFRQQSCAGEPWPTHCTPCRLSDCLRSWW